MGNGNHQARRIKRASTNTHGKNEESLSIHIADYSITTDNITDEITDDISDNNTVHNRDLQETTSKKGGNSLKRPGCFQIPNASTV